MQFEIIPVTPHEQNCSLLWCEQSCKAAIIDPGGDLWQIEDYLEWLELELEVILITHGHCDHAGGAAELARRTGARIEGPHRDDAAMLATLAEQTTTYRIPAEPFTPDIWLDDGCVVSFGGESLEVLHCPGHARGHLAYFHRPGRQAFVGDILFRNAIGAWEHPYGELRDLLRSIREKLFPLGDDVRFVPGHGPVSTFGRERRENPFVSDAAIGQSGLVLSPQNPPACAGKRRHPSDSGA